MPMSRDERIEKVQRLLTAHKTTREALESKPVTWELHPGTDIARNWPVITAAYSGLEQTLNYLIADQAGISIPELIDLAAPPNAGIDQPHARRHPYCTHNLAWLFSKLDAPARDVVRAFYGRFRSQHSYVAVADADKFLNQVSVPRGTGYERWRYTLIEDRPLIWIDPVKLLQRFSKSSPSMCWIQGAAGMIATVDRSDIRVLVAT